MVTIKVVSPPTQSGVYRLAAQNNIGSGATQLRITTKLKEGKDVKDKDKEKEKEDFEKDRSNDRKDGQDGGSFGLPSGGVVVPPEGQMGRTAMDNSLTHFIAPDARPDLARSALGKESDLSHDELAAISQRLLKHASDTKQAKDTKDVETRRER